MISPDDLRAFVLSLPEVSELETWGHPTFRVRGKIFATLSVDGAVSGVKCTLAEQQALVQERPDVFAVPAYVGRHGWVSVRTARLDPGEMCELLLEGWRMTAPKRLVKAYDEAHPTPET